MDVNEQIFYAEKATYRGISGATAIFPRGDGTVSSAVLPTIGTIPLGRTLTGQILSTGKDVRGDAATNFIDEVHLGDFIYAQNVLRQVTNVLSKNMLVLRNAFPADIAAAINLVVCKPQRFKRIRAKCTHATVAAVLQEAAFKVGDEFENGGAPISYDGTGSEISFTVHE